MTSIRIDDSALLLGLDQIGAILADDAADIAAFEKHQRSRRHGCTSNAISFPLSIILKIGFANEQRSLKAAIEAGEFIIAPGLHDMIAAVICNKVGFDFVYASGYWTTASAYGLPDAGIATYSQMLDRVATLVRTVNAGVIADADTGYGGLLNVHHTVRGYEEVGVVAIQIEDQEFPKKCGHTPFKKVVPTADMVEKVKVACALGETPRRLS